MSLRFSKGRWEIDFYTHGRSGERIRTRLAPDVSEEEAREIYAVTLARYKDAPVAPLDLWDLPLQSSPKSISSGMICTGLPPHSEARD
jgi:hypothetical protein